MITYSTKKKRKNLLNNFERLKDDKKQKCDKNSADKTIIPKVLYVMQLNCQNHWIRL
jgi:hypothetical protein